MTNALQVRIHTLWRDFQQKAPYRNVVVILASLGSISIILHSLNLYYYPAWFFDEGAYLTFGLQWLQTGHLTYYEHPFAFLGFLSILFATINPSSYLIPRIFMVLISGLDTVLVYLIVKRFYAGGLLLPVFAALVYATTPLSMRYLRLVVVDNFMTFFLLLSIFFLLCGNKWYAYSALCFGLAFLSKQTAIFFAPAILFLIIKNSVPPRIPKMLTWIGIAAIPVILWIVYGISQVGLSNLIAQQLVLTNLSGERAVSAGNLIIQRITSRDPFVFIGIVGIVWAIYKRYVIVIFPLAYLLSFILLFLKISTVYLIPVLPFFSILAALIVFDFMKYFPSLFRHRDFRILTVACLIILLAIVSGGLSSTESPATPQEQALHYVGSLGHARVIVSYTYLWLLEQNYPNVIPYDRYYPSTWTSLPNGTRIYLIVDYPGDLPTIHFIKQLDNLYETAPKTNFTDPNHTYVVQVVNSTIMT